MTRKKHAADFPNRWYTAWVDATELDDAGRTLRVAAALVYLAHGQQFVTARPQDIARIAGLGPSTGVLHRLSDMIRRGMLERTNTVTEDGATRYQLFMPGQPRPETFRRRAPR